MPPSAAPPRATCSRRLHQRPTLCQPVAAMPRPRSRRRRPYTLGGSHMGRRDPIERLEGRLLFAAGLDLTGVEFRTIDGWGNNQTILDQGAAETEQIRFGYQAA